MMNDIKMINDNELDLVAGGSALDDALEAFKNTASLGNPDIYSGGTGVSVFC